MNVFNKIVDDLHANDTRLGIPSTDLAHHDRRMTAMASMTNGRGFRTPGKEPKADSQGLTRGDRNRALRAATNAKVSEDRDTKFLNSFARRALAA